MGSPLTDGLPTVSQNTNPTVLRSDDENWNVDSIAMGAGSHRDNQKCLKKGVMNGCAGISGRKKSFHAITWESVSFKDIGNRCKELPARSVLKRGGSDSHIWVIAYCTGPACNVLELKDESWAKCCESCTEQQLLLAESAKPRKSLEELFKIE